MPKVRCFIAIGMLSLAAVVTNHGSANAAGMLMACNQDVQKFCSSVTPGNGRVASCIYAHEDKVSDECDAAVADIADLIDGFFASLAVAYETCAPDIEKFCSDVKAGEGRIVSCLSSRSAELQSGCGSLVSGFASQLTE